MALLQFACPHCQGVFQVDDSMGGQTVACPHCQGHVQVAATIPETTNEPLPREEQAAGHVASRFPEPPSFPGQSIPNPPSIPQRPGATTMPPRPGAASGVPTIADKNEQFAAKSRFEVICGKCTGTFRSNPAMIGQQVLCPFCNARLIVPEEGGRATIADAPITATLSPPAVTSPSNPAPLSGDRAILIDKPLETRQSMAESTAGEREASKAKDEKPRTESSIFKPASGEEVVDPELAVKDEGTRLVKVGDQYVEIRRLSPEEKAARRFKRNVIMVTMAAAVLGVVIFFLVRQ